MGEIIESLSTYFFYGIGIFVISYWLLLIPKDEKIKNIKNTYNRFLEVFSKDEEYEERVKKEKQEKK